MKKFFLGFCALLLSSLAFASQGLVIHTAEFGVGKFHRADNAVHAYSADHSWVPYILANGARTDQPLVQKNQDGSYTVFFLTLEDMISSVMRIAKDEKQPVSVLNVHGHGLPGRMWFPKNEFIMKGWTCDEWREAASGSDSANYRQYYSPMSAMQVEQIRSMSNNPNLAIGCTTGLEEWREALAKTPEFKNIFAPDAQIHFLSCVVGLGTVGEAFTQGIAALLLSHPAGRVETSVNFGLGDWSMPAGMGFWDYIDDEQLKRDGALYSKNRNDSEIAQKGTIRVAVYSGDWRTSLYADRPFMSIRFQPTIEGFEVREVRTPYSAVETPSRIRVPGTNAFVTVEQR